jgi:hypothetical protein
MWQKLCHLKSGRVFATFSVLSTNPLIPTVDAATFRKWQKVCHSSNVAMQLFLPIHLFFVYLVN